VWPDERESEPRAVARSGREQGFDPVGHVAAQDSDGGERGGGSAALYDRLHLLLPTGCSCTSRTIPWGGSVAGTGLLSLRVDLRQGLWSLPMRPATTSPAELRLLAGAAMAGAKSTVEKRQLSVRRFAEHLAQFPGQTWQQRWLASGWNSPMRCCAA
jgi:hypothetical protein